MSEGFLASLASIVRDVRSPDGLSRYVGLILFVFGILRGPFTTENQMIEWGVTCFFASFAWWYLSRITFMQRDWQGLDMRRTVIWSRVICGLVLLTITAVLFYHFYHQITDSWLIPPILKKYFPMAPSDVRA